MAIIPEGYLPRGITVPPPYAGEAYLEDAYRQGYNHGHGIACHNVPTLGERIFSEGLGRVTVDAENIREVHADACHEAASNARCYSPFEFVASEFNGAGEGGFRFETADGEWSDVFDCVEDAVTARNEDWADDLDNASLIEEVPSADELWEAFEAGTEHAINADLSTYEDADYGIEDEAEDDSDPDAEAFDGTPWDTWRREVATLWGVEPRYVSAYPGAYEAFNGCTTPAQFIQDEEA